MPHALQPVVRAVGAGLILAFLCASGASAQTPPAAPAPASSPGAGGSAPRCTRPRYPAGLRAWLSRRRSAKERTRSRRSTSRPGSGKPATTLAHQLFVVLDARLPARLTQVSDSPEGSRANPLKPNEEIVGAVPAADGSIDIVVERVAGPDAKPIWLFSTATLNAVPTLYSEVTFGLDERSLPRILTGRKVGGVRVLEWLVVLLGIPLFYFVTVLLDRLLRPAGCGTVAKALQGFDVVREAPAADADQAAARGGRHAVAAERPAAAADAPPVRVQRCGAPQHRGARLAGDPLQSSVRSQCHPAVSPWPGEPRRNRWCVSRAEASTCWSSSSACWRRSGISASIRRPRLPVSALAVLRWRWRHRRPSRT